MEQNKIINNCKTKEANTKKEKECSVESKGGWLCTREKGHKGLHHAHSLPKRCLCRWK